MAKITAGPVPMLIRQVSSVMDGSGIPSKDDVDFIPVIAGEGNMIYANPADTTDVEATAGGGLFEFEGHAHVREIHASCGSGATMDISIVDGAGIAKGPKGAYAIASAQGADGTVIHLNPSVTIFPGQKLKIEVTGTAEQFLVGVSVVKYPEHA